MNAGENQIVVYQPNEIVRLDVRADNHPWARRLNPQGDIGAPRIWQVAAKH